jgi:hypothetical protein
MVRMKKRGVRVLFAARDENREHTEGVWEFLAVPVTGPEIVARVKRMLATRRNATSRQCGGSAACGWRAGDTVRIAASRADATTTRITLKVATGVANGRSQ